MCSQVEVYHHLFIHPELEAEESSQTTPTRLYDIITIKAVVLHLQKHCNSRSGHTKLRKFAVGRTVPCLV